MPESRGAELVRGRIVWVVNPMGNRITEYRRPDQIRVLGVRDVLEGHDVLPGFRYPVADLFDVEKSPRYSVNLSRALAHRRSLLDLIIKRSS